MARGPAQSDRGARGGESRLDGILRPGPCDDAGRFRHARRDTVASGVARLAGVRIQGLRLEHQKVAPPYRDLRYVSPIVESLERTLREGRLQPPARPRAARA